MQLGQGMVVISDATTLIHFGRIDALDILRAMYGTIIIVPEVKVEIMEGDKFDPPKSDIGPIRQALDCGWLKPTGYISDNVASVLSKRGRPGHDGESKSIDFLWVIHEQGEEAVFLTDDGEAFVDASRYARVLSTLHVVEEARKQGHDCCSNPVAMYQQMGIRESRVAPEIQSDFQQKYGRFPFSLPFE